MIKRIIMMLTFCLCAGVTLGQDNHAKVTIAITSGKADSIWVWITRPERKFFQVKPDKDHKFVVNFNEQTNVLFTFGTDVPKKSSSPIFVEKGDQLHVTTDFDKNILFSGKGAENARVLNLCTKAYAAAYHEKELEVGDKMLSPSAAFNMYYGLGLVPLNVLLANKQNVSPVFYQDQYISFFYEKLNFPIMIPKLMAMSGKKLSESIPDNYWDIEKEVKIDDKLGSNPVYLRFMTNGFLTFLTFKERLKQGTLDSAISADAETRLKWNLVESIYPNKLKHAAILQIVQVALEKTKDLQLVKPLMEEYIRKYATASEAKELKDKYNKLNNLSAGKTPPPFTLKDLNGKDVTLKDFAGKVVYMDFWASWCSPCRYEMKNGSPKLHARFKENKDVVFLYVSLDSKIDAWKKAIADDKIEGIHLLSQASSGVNSAVGKAFNISGIPRYVIIGKDGKIFDNNAPRPSEDITPDKINEALNTNGK
jgi:peroxiredoxin